MFSCSSMHIFSASWRKRVTTEASLANCGSTVFKARIPLTAPTCSRALWKTPTPPAPRPPARGPGRRRPCRRSRAPRRPRICPRPWRRARGWWKRPFLLAGADDRDRRCVVLAAGAVGGSDQLAAHRFRVVSVCGENDLYLFFRKHSGDAVAAQHVEVARKKLEVLDVRRHFVRRAERAREHVAIGMSARLGLGDLVLAQQM